jgi:hypothetical protein
LLLGLVEVAAQVIRGARADASSLAGLWALLPPLFLGFLVLRFVFRQQPIWGSMEGLRVGEGRRSRRIPWSKVGPPEWAWYSFQAPGSLRVASIEVEGEPRRIFFYADDDSFERLSSWRAEGRTASRSSSRG